MGFAGHPANHYRCKHRRLMNPVYWQMKRISSWGGLDSNQRPTDYESSRKRSMEPNLA
jgi:hypothetical protein